MKNLLKKIKDESGQALVIVAASVIVLMGVTAFSVDMGMAYNAKAELQAAADAAALAGAQDLPNASLAAETANSYVDLNYDDVDKVVVTTPYKLNPKQIEVTCEKTFEYMFAKVLGFDSKVIKVRAVATSEATWEGDALPFINLDDSISGGQIVLWEKVDPKSPGDYERLWDNNNPDPEYIITGTAGNYRSTLTDLTDDLIAIKSGISNDEPKIESICSNLKASGGSVYVLSLTDEARAEYQALIASKDFTFGNKTQITIEDIVLLECKVTDYDFSNTVNRGITLTRTSTPPYSLYDVVHKVGPVPPDLSGLGKRQIKLVE